MYYIEKGLKQKWMAIFFSVMVIIAYFVVGAIVDTNTICLSVQAQWGIKPIITGIIFSILTAVVILGGIKRIGEVCQFLTPIMAGLYILAGLAIILLNLTSIPAAFAEIFKGAVRRLLLPLFLYFRTCMEDGAMDTHSNGSDSYLSGRYAGRSVKHFKERYKQSSGYIRCGKRVTGLCGLCRDGGHGTASVSFCLSYT